MRTKKEKKKRSIPKRKWEGKREEKRIILKHLVFRRSQTTAAFSTKSPLTESLVHTFRSYQRLSVRYLFIENRHKPVCPTPAFVRVLFTAYQRLSVCYCLPAFVRVLFTAYQGLSVCYLLPTSVCPCVIYCLPGFVCVLFTAYQGLSVCYLLPTRVCPCVIYCLPGFVRVLFIAYQGLSVCYLLCLFDQQRGTADPKIKIKIPVLRTQTWQMVSFKACSRSVYLPFEKKKKCFHWHSEHVSCESWVVRFLPAVREKTWTETTVYNILAL